MFTFQSVADAPKPHDIVPDALPWILEAANPYYEWLFGDPKLTAKILEAWTRRATSEFSIMRAQLLLCDCQVAGGFIALDGIALRRARKADAVALLSAVPASDRSGLARRLANASDLFSRVGDDEYYLSKMGLHPTYRGKGYARELLARYVDNGKASGHVRYRLDVSAGNVSAIRRYEEFGFQFASRAQTKDGALEYCSMTFQLEDA